MTAGSDYRQQEPILFDETASHKSIANLISFIEGRSIDAQTGVTRGVVGVAVLVLHPRRGGTLSRGRLRRVPVA